METLEHEKRLLEFKRLTHQSKMLIKRDTDCIPSLDQLHDKCKGEWVEHEDNNFHAAFNGLLDYCMNEEEIDNLDWNTVNYEIYDAQYYQEHFPGFDERVYHILAESTKEENKLIILKKIFFQFFM